jgi:ethanolamine kinase
VFLVFEFSGTIDIDFSRYPSRDYQLNWLRMYLESSFKHRGLQPSDVTDLEVERLYVQVQKFALVSFVKSQMTVSSG